MKYLFCAAAATLSTAAMAQTAMTPATTPPAATATAPATATPVQSAPATSTTAQPTTVTEAAPQPAANPREVIAQQFPNYDKDSNGTLSQAEFAAWLSEMKTAQNTEKLTPAQISTWANDSFAKADKDKSKSVTVAELQGYLVPAA